MLKTNIPDHLRSSLNEEAVSVIHAPQSFQSWVRHTLFLIPIIVTALMLFGHTQQPLADELKDVH